VNKNTCYKLAYHFDEVRAQESVHEVFVVDGIIAIHEETELIGSNSERSVHEVMYCPVKKKKKNVSMMFRVDGTHLPSWMRSEFVEVFDGTQKLGQDRVIPPTVSWLGRVGRYVGH
jgi:hypothetical protein